MSEQDFAPEVGQAQIDAIANTRLFSLVIGTVSASISRESPFNLKYQAWTWDTIISFSEEVEVFMGRSIALIDIVYTLSRYLISAYSRNVFRLPLTVFIYRVLMGLAIYIASGFVCTYDLLLRYPPIVHSFSISSFSYVDGL